MNKSNIIGLVLVGLIMFGFSWYQSRQYREQMEVQAQADSVARVEQMAAMAMDSMKKAHENPLSSCLERLFPPEMLCHFL